MKSTFNLDIYKTLSPGIKKIALKEYIRTGDVDCKISTGQRNILIFIGFHNDSFAYRTEKGYSRMCSHRRPRLLCEPEWEHYDKHDKQIADIVAEHMLSEYLDREGSLTSNKRLVEQVKRLGRRCGGDRVKLWVLEKSAVIVIINYACIYFILSNDETCQHLLSTQIDDVLLEKILERHSNKMLPPQMIRKLFE